MCRAAVLLLTFAVCPVLAQDKKDAPAPPNSAPPQFVIVARIDPAQDILVLRMPVVVPANVIQKVEKVEDGKKVLVDVVVTVYKTEHKEVPYKLTSHRAMDVSGKILSGWSRIKNDQVVLIAWEPFVDPAYRKLLAKDTVILVPAPPEVKKD